MICKKCKNPIMPMQIKVTENPISNVNSLTQKEFREKCKKSKYYHYQCHLNKNI